MKRIRIHIDHLVVDGDNNTTLESARSALMQEFSTRFEAGVPQNLERSSHHSQINILTSDPATRYNWPASVAKAIVGDSGPSAALNNSTPDQP